MIPYIQKHSERFHSSRPRERRENDEKSNPKYIYSVVHPISIEAHGVKYFEELPLGTGAVDFPVYLAALEAVGYRGYLTIER